jgi:hypothetical protein
VKIEIDFPIAAAKIARPSPALVAILKRIKAT